MQRTNEIDSLKILIVGRDGGPGNVACWQLEAAKGQRLVVKWCTVLPENLEADILLLEQQAVDAPIEELCRRHTRIPVIVLADTYDEQQALSHVRQGADSYLTAEDLRVDLEDILRRARERKLQAVQPSAPSRSKTDTQDLSLPRIGQGSRIGSYVVTRCLGIGSMGCVYLAKSTAGTEKEYAIKVLKRASGQSRSMADLERFQREAEAERSLDHPNLVKVFDVGWLAWERTPYIVMEHVDGETLADCYKDLQSISYEGRVRIILQVAKALQVIHSHYICHRDLKPRNILITRDRTVKVVDLGLVRQPNSHLTLTDSLMGTPAFMAPEAFDSPRVDGRADIFSLGVISYLLLLGELPFELSSITQIARAICNARPKDPLRFDAAFPVELRRILAKMLRKRPARRYQCMQEVIADLSRYLEWPDHRMPVVTRWLLTWRAWS